MLTVTQAKEEAARNLLSAERLALTAPEASRAHIDIAHAYLRIVGA